MTDEQNIAEPYMDGINAIRKAKAMEYQQYLLRERARLLLELQENGEQLERVARVGDKRRRGNY